MLAVPALLGPLACLDSSGPSRPSTIAPVVVTPACDAPAPLLGTYDQRAPSVLVRLRPGTDVAAEVERLTTTHAFTPTHVFALALQGFSAELTPEKLAALRCEASVESVRWSAVYTMD